MPPRVIPQLSDTPEIVVRVLATVPGLTVQALAPNLRGVQNAFAPWTVPGQEAQR